MAVFIVDGIEYNLEGKKIDNRVISAVVNGKPVEVEFVKERENIFVLKNGTLIPVFFARDCSNNIFLSLSGEDYVLHQKTVEEQAENASGGEESGDIEPPMPGKVLKINVKEGQSVKENDVLLLMESMKLQVEIKAPFDGVVAKISAKEGQTVNAGEVIAKIEKSV